MSRHRETAYGPEWNDPNGVSWISLPSSLSSRGAGAQSGPRRGPPEAPRRPGALLHGPARHLPVLRHRRPGRDAASPDDRGGGPFRGRRPRLRRSGHRQVHRDPGPRRPAAADEGGDRLSLFLRSRQTRRRMPALFRPRRRETKPPRAGAGGGPAAGRHRGPGGGRARLGDERSPVARRRSSRGCWPAPIAASSTSTRSTSSTITSSISSSTWRPPGSTPWSARG